MRTRFLQKRVVGYNMENGLEGKDMSEIQNVFYPQDEIRTVLVPVTVGCRYNQCVFCCMYKENDYREVCSNRAKTE